MAQNQPFNFKFTDASISNRDNSLFALARGSLKVDAPVKMVHIERQRKSKDEG
ncbi:hypothetical protein HMPREF0530_1041 [Lacticaseibacillus paracasei subsp. paracasei ATCC 25302 = DSM 5622 = JCM 8130]|nr:hypothetical protein HMPREF0530_1041 [Lacticaseibacillus paracasei subsp. paracasei ATCC 25302 = DSM 5622 = JCM 8130]